MVIFSILSDATMYQKLEWEYIFFYKKYSRQAQTSACACVVYSLLTQAPSSFRIPVGDLIHLISAMGFSSKNLLSGFSKSKISSA